MQTKIIEVKNLKTFFFFKKNAVIKAVDGLDFTVRQGETLGIVGESGCGKSMTAFSIMGLTPPPGKITEGEILFQGKDLTKLNNSEMRKIRGKHTMQQLLYREGLLAKSPRLPCVHQPPLHEKEFYSRKTDIL